VTPKPPIRPARASDLDDLVDLELRAFSTDRVSRRSFRRFLASPRASLTAAGRPGQFLGYALVLFRPPSPLARLYSIAVAPEAAGRGIGKALLWAAEAAARARGCSALRLEVAERNRKALRLYKAAGYCRFGRREDYYEDGTAALRLEKHLLWASDRTARHNSTK
jgi:ribosomal protein S18 acetylase RimI-like enzyme